MDTFIVHIQACQAVRNPDMEQCQVLAVLILAQLPHSDQRNTGEMHPQTPILREVVAMGALRSDAVGKERIRWVAGLMEAASCAGEPTVDGNRDAGCNLSTSQCLVLCMSPVGLHRDLTFGTTAADACAVATVKTKSLLPIIIIHSTMHLPSPSTLPAPSCRPLTAAPRISTTPKSPRATILCASHRAHAAAALLAAATLHLSTPCWAAGTTPEASSSRPGGVDPDSSPLVQELLARSKANKEANDKARLVRNPLG